MDEFWQTIATVALGGLLVGFSSLVTLIVQNRSADARRASDIARDDRLRGEDRTNAERVAAARYERSLRERHVEDIDAYVREVNRVVARMRVQLLAAPGVRALPDVERIPGREEWESLHTSMYNAAAAAELLDPRGPLTEAVDAARESVNAYDVTLKNLPPSEQTPVATLDALNGTFTGRMAHLRRLMDSHRVEPT